MDIPLLLDMAADAAPDRLALGRRDTGLQASLLADRVKRMAALFAGTGHVVHIGENDDIVAELLLAGACAGVPFVPLNYRLADDQLRSLLRRASPALAVVDESMESRVAGVPGVRVIGRERFEHVLSDIDAAGQPAERDVAAILFTSGTTAEPKAAILRHRHLASYVIGSVDFQGAEEGEAALISVPSYHVAGIAAVLTSLYAGRRIVYLRAFSPEAWIETVEREGITHAMVVPTMLKRIVEVAEETGASLPSLRAVSYGGGRMPLAVVERALALFPHVDFVNAYGLTETSSTIALLDADDHRICLASEDAAVRRRLGSVGRPLPSVQIVVRDPDGHAVPVGEPGEIWVKGDQIAGEYAGRDPLLSDGWFATRDCGWIDQDGYLFVDGRLDDVIVRGGENISPGEIEDVLRQHDAVSDVAVIGIPDEEWGEQVAAAIVARTPVSQDDLAQWVRQRLKSTRTPGIILFVDALPYNETGKLLRRTVRGWFEQGNTAVPLSNRA